LTSVVEKSPKIQIKIFIPYCLSHVHPKMHRISSCKGPFRYPSANDNVYLPQNKSGSLFNQ